MTKKRVVYLDHAAATPVDSAVLAAMQPYFSDDFFNPSATYEAARKVRADIELAKKRIAAGLGVKLSELILTSGGTESNNLAIAGIMENFPAGQVLASSIEHDSVLGPTKMYEHAWLPVDKAGILDIDRAAQAINDDTVLVSVILANNEVGTIQPLGKLSREITKIRADRRDRKVSSPLYLHSDATQAPLYLDVNPHRLGVDLMTLNGGKVYGPKGSGMLYVRAGVDLQAQMLGGGQQRGRRSGTESAAHAVGLAEALQLAREQRASEVNRLSALQKYFFDRLIQICPGAIVNGSRKKRLPNNLHFTIPGIDNERLIIQLDELGIMAASGSACSAAEDETSHVLLAMGVSDEAARSSLRFTMGRSTQKNDLEYTLASLASTVT